jgi:hypothetical protein
MSLSASAETVFVWLQDLFNCCVLTQKDYVYANEEVKEILDRAIPEKPTKQLQTPHRSVRGGYGTLCLIIDITNRTSGVTSGSNLAWLSTNNS